MSDEPVDEPIYYTRIVPRSEPWTPVEMEMIVRGLAPVVEVTLEEFKRLYASEKSEP